MEVWKSVKGYEGLYQVSNQGRVKREAGSPKCLLDRILSHRMLGQWKYPGVSLCKDGQSTNRYIHDLVAQAFIGPRPEDAQVNHKDTRHDNNRADNLEYLTPLGNSQHALSAGCYKRGENHVQAKLLDAAVQTIKSSTEKGKDLAARFNVSQSMISLIRHGKARVRR